MKGNILSVFGWLLLLFVVVSNYTPWELSTPLTVTLCAVSAVCLGVGIFLKDKP